MPAPPEGSKPAMVRMIGGAGLMWLLKTRCPPSRTRMARDFARSSRRKRGRLQSPSRLSRQLKCTRLIRCNARNIFALRSYTTTQQGLAATASEKKSKAGRTRSADRARPGSNGKPESFVPSASKAQRLRKQAADQRSLGDAPDRQDVRCGAHVRVILAHGLVDVMERALHHRLEPQVHFILLPEVALQVLRPLEVAHRHAAGVCQDVGQHEDTLAG